MGLVVSVYSRQEALEKLREGCFTPLAGGTDIFVQLHQNPDQHPFLLDISPVKEWYGCRVEGELCLGPLSTMAVVEGLRTAGLNALWQAAKQVGGPQVRNRATLGGNLQTASPAGDLSVALLGLGTTLELSSYSQSRCLPLEYFFLDARSTDKKETEIIESIRVPTVWKYSRYYKLGQRKALAIATVSLAFAWDGRQFRVALGSVYKTPLLARKTMEVLNGGGLNAARISRAKAALIDEIFPIDDQRASAAYRKMAAEQLLEDALSDFRKEMA